MLLGDQIEPEPGTGIRLQVQDHFRYYRHPQSGEVQEPQPLLFTEPALAVSRAFLVGMNVPLHTFHFHLSTATLHVVSLFFK